MSLHLSSASLRTVLVWMLVVVPLILQLEFWAGRSETSEGVRLRLTTEAFETSNRLELRFQEDMIAADAVGRAVVESPLAVEPPLKGTFVWLSSRHGVYTRDEWPRMGTTYRFRLASGLRNVRGQVTSARLNRSLTAAGFDLANVRTSYRTDANNPGRPRIYVAFNAEVQPTALAPFCEFANGRQSIPAEVKGFHNHELPGHHLAGNPGLQHSQVPAVWNSLRAPDDKAIRNAVSIEPRSPLPPGDDWQLVLRKGLPSGTGGFGLAQERFVRIGTVSGMSVTHIAAVNSYASPKRLEVRLTQHPSGMPADELAATVTIQPRPAGLEIVRSYRALTINGAFELGQDYRVKVRAGLRAGTGERLMADVERTVRFTPLAPRVMLATGDGIQMASGDARLDYLAYNTRRLRMRVKRLDADTLIQTLNGYQQRFRNAENERDYPFELVPGKPVTTRYLVTGATNDVVERATVDLQGLTAGHGALFVDLQPVETGHRVGAQAIVQRTDLGLLWKRGGDGLTVRVFGLSDGRPRAGVEVSLKGDANETLVQARTDEQGAAGFPTDKGADWIKAQDEEGDLVVLRLDEGQLNRYGFGVPVTWKSVSEAEQRMFLFTDRPVYEPGDVVHLKGIHRRLDDQLKLPAAGQMRVLTLFDSEGAAVLRTNLASSGSGGVDWSFAAPTKHRGWHQVTAETGGQEARHSFLVADHEADAFEMTLGGRRDFAVDEAIEIPVTARYLFGSAVTDARIIWTAEMTETAFESEALPGFVFGEQVQIGVLERETDHGTLKGEARIGGAEGTRLKMELPAAGNPRAIKVSVEVTDLSRQTLSQRVHVLLHGAEFYLGCLPPAERPRAGTRPRLQLVAALPDGKIRQEVTAIALRVDKLVWRSTRVGGAGGSIDYRNEVKLLEVVQTNLMLGGLTAYQMPELPGAGQYLITLNGSDGAGRPLETRTVLEVAGADEVVWDYRNAAQLDLEPDRKRYRPGDVAELLVKSPIDGTAFVTLERNRVHHSFSTNLSGGAPVIRIPIRREDAPNIFASVAVVRGAEASRRQYAEPEFRYGYAQLEVEDNATRLQVQLETGRREYRPGERVAVTCEIKNSRGRPQRNAEVTLYAVDDGVLRMTGAAAPDPHGYFHEAQPLAVRTHLSLTELMPADPADLRFHNKGYLIGGGGREDSRGREKIAGSPLWQPALITDRQGRVTAEFAVPGNLTRYRIMAVAHSGADRFGTGECTIEVNQPLVIEPALPNFARVGDRLNLRAMVVNRTKQAGEVEVIRRSGGAGVESRKVIVAAGAAVPVGFPTGFDVAGRVEWRWEAKFTEAARAGEGDVVTQGITVLDAMPARRQVALGRVRGATNLLAGIDGAMLKPGARAHLVLTTSPLLEVRAGLEHLLQYPYGCVEQTASRLLPWLSLARVRGLSNLMERPAAEVDIAIAAGVERLFSMQNEDGGLSYWPGGRVSMLWGSAYAGVVLSQSSTRPETAWRALLAYLRKELLETDPHTGTAFDEAHAMALCALSLGGEALPEWHSRVHERRASLSGETRVLTAWAEMAGPGRIEVARDLLKGAGNDPEQRPFFGSRARQLAMEAIAWSKLDRDKAAAVARELLGERRGGQWITTQGNAWALMALVSAATPPDSKAAAVQLRSGSGDESLALEDGQFFERHFDPNAGRGVELSVEEGGGLYALLQVATPVARNAPAEGNRGYRVVRNYERLNGPGEWRVGDSIRVTLGVKAEGRAEYVVIDDPLPAVLEAIQPELKTRQTAGAEADRNELVSHQELRRDRALFFCDRLPKGEHRFEYLARVRAPGQAFAPPVKVEEMYAPERHGTSSGETVEAGL